METDRRFGSLRVTRTLERIIEELGAPQRICSDTTPEIVVVYLAWAEGKKIEPVHIRLGKPIENAPTVITGFGLNPAAIRPARLAAAEAQLHQAERQALTDVEKAHQAYLAASRAIALYNRANLKQVEDVRSITAYSYQRGAVSLFELLDAERMARQTLVTYNQARAAYQMALFQLRRSCRFTAALIRLGSLMMDSALRTAETMVGVIMRVSCFFSTK